MGRENRDDGGAGSAAPDPMVLVVGVDAARPSAWVAVALREGRLEEMSTHPTLAAVADRFQEASVFAIDVPMGHDDPEGTIRGGRRACDEAARILLGPQRRASVFGVPPLEVLRHGDHAEAVAACRRRGWAAPSAQLWAIRPRILECHAVAHDARFFEIHPEVGFHALASSLGKPVPQHAKTSWSGLVERLALLHDAKLRPERSLGGVGRASPDDVLDATIAAWSAHRIATREAKSLPSAPPQDPTTARSVAIWY